MAQLSNITLPNGTKYGLKGSIYSVVGTQTAATGSWTGVLNSIDALYDGLTIAYWLPYAGSGNATLNLTLSNGTTGAINCYFKGNTRLTTHYAAGSMIWFTYWSAGSIKINGTATTDNRWIAGQNYEDGNTVPTVYIETAANTQAKVGTMTNGALATGYYVCSIVNSNTYNGKITLNINGKGAKDIYINGTVSSSTNKTLNAGSYIAYYNGTAFYFRNDGKIPKLIDSGSLTVSTGAAATVSTGASVTVTAGTAASLTTSSYTVTPVTSKTVVTSATMPSMYILPATTGSVPTAGLDCLYINSGSVSTGASITTGTAQTIKGVNVFTANSPTKVTSKTVVTAVTPATVVTAVSNA